MCKCFILWVDTPHVQFSWSWWWPLHCDVDRDFADVLYLITPGITVNSLNFTGTLFLRIAESLHLWEYQMLRFQNVYVL